MKMDTIIADWKQNAERHGEQNLMFIRSLKMKDGRVVDRKAHRLHEEAFSIIDCTQCANCCKTIYPLLTEEDIQRIAQHLGMDGSDFRAEYLEVDDDGRLKMTGLPCPFLCPRSRRWATRIRPPRS